MYINNDAGKKAGEISFNVGHIIVLVMGTHPKVSNAIIFFVARQYTYSFKFDRIDSDGGPFPQPSLSLAKKRIIAGTNFIAVIILIHVPSNPSIKIFIFKLLAGGQCG